MKYPAVTYYDYLKLTTLLSAQVPRGPEFGLKAHDEMLFIVVHQTYELWFRQILWELESVLEIFRGEDVHESQMGLACARLERIYEIQKLINQQIDVLETMTPLDFMDFRDALFPASGFQSFQWRAIETLLGLKTEQRLQFNGTPFHQALTPAEQTRMLKMLEGDSLFDGVEKWLARTPFLKDGDFEFWKSYRAAVEQLLSDDLRTVDGAAHLNDETKARTRQQIEGSLATFRSIFEPAEYAKLQASGYFRMSLKALQGALFIQIYRDEPALQQPFRLLQVLQNIDEKMTEWRYKHALMAHRMLGRKIGTGGTSGHEYLRAATEKHKIYGDFFNLATFLIPRRQIPALPAEIRERMSFRY